jgi:ribosome-associated protein
VLDTLDKAALIAHLADEKKAEDIVVLDVRGLCNFADAFVVCTGSNRIQLNAISDNIADGIRKRGMKYPPEDGERGANWLALDAGDVVVHIMSPEARSFYRLERLWGDAEPYDWQKALEDLPQIASAR